MFKNIKHIKNHLVKSLFLNNDERSLNIKSNIYGSSLLKILNLAISFLVVPIALNYLDKYHYGLWIALSSFIGWFFMFDLGLGSGLRNKFAEAKASNDFQKTKVYVSTTYFLILLVVFLMCIIFVLLSSFIKWSVLLNTSINMEKELKVVIISVFFIMSPLFLLRLIGVILSADQKTFLNDMLMTLGNLGALLGLLLISSFSKGSLLIYSIVYSIVPLIIYSGASVYYFNSKYRYCRPSFHFVDMNYTRELMSTGLLFFLQQIANLVIFQTSYIFISHYLGPEEVTKYSVTYKYYSMVPMFYLILLNSYWSGFTDAYTKGDIKWIKRVLKKFRYLWLISVIAYILLIICNELFFQLWLKNKVEVSYMLSLTISIYFLLNYMNSHQMYFLNSINKMKIQCYYSVFQMLLFLPLAYLFTVIFKMGCMGIVLSLIVLVIPGCVLYPIYVNKELRYFCSN